MVDERYYCQYDCYYVNNVLKVGKHRIPFAPWVDRLGEAVDLPRSQDEDAQKPTLDEEGAEYIVPPEVGPGKDDKKDVAHLEDESQGEGGNSLYVVSEEKGGHQQQPNVEEDWHVDSQREVLVEEGAHF